MLRKGLLYYQLKMATSFPSHDSSNHWTILSSLCCPSYILTLLLFKFISRGFFFLPIQRLEIRDSFDVKEARNYQMTIGHRIDTIDKFVHRGVNTSLQVRTSFLQGQREVNR